MANKTDSERSVPLQRQNTRRDTESPPNYTRRSDSKMHSNFFFTLVTFKVGDTLFRVPRHAFETESTAFSRLLLSEIGEDKEYIELSGVSTDEFCSLLKVLYPQPKPSEKNLTSNEWVSALIISNKWGFEKIRKLAMDNLKNLNPIKKLKLAKDLKITENDWIHPAVYQLVNRKETLSEKEAADIGLSTAMKINRIRDKQYTSILRLLFTPPVFIQENIKDEFK